MPTWRRRRQMETTTMRRTANLRRAFLKMPRRMRMGRGEGVKGQARSPNGDRLAVFTTRRHNGTILGNKKESGSVLVIGGAKDEVGETEGLVLESQSSTWDFREGQQGTGLSRGGVNAGWHAPVGVLMDQEDRISRGGESCRSSGAVRSAGSPQSHKQSDRQCRGRESWGIAKRWLTSNSGAITSTLSGEGGLELRGVIKPHLPRYFELFSLVQPTMHARWCCSLKLLVYQALSC